MSSAPIGRLERVSLREAWLSEAQDFTPWLAQPENLAMLSQALEVNLELDSQEKRVGPFRADILCRNISDDSWVLIENQLERTDHSHLGQLLTYAAGLSAVSIVWIAEQFTDEHRAALDWLNEKTPEEINFFGLEVELWKIGDSPVAPKFNIVCKPNDWTRQVIKAREPNSEIAQFCQDFWSGVFDLAQQKGLPLQVIKPRRRRDCGFDVGWHSFRLKAYFSTVKDASSVWVSCRGPRAFENFAKLQSQRAEVETAFGAPLAWRGNQDKNQGYIESEIHGFCASDREAWPKQQAEMTERLLRLYRALAPFVEPLDAEVEDSFAEE